MDATAIIQNFFTGVGAPIVGTLIVFGFLAKKQGIIVSALIAVSVGAVLVFGSAVFPAIGVGLANLFKSILGL